MESLTFSNYMFAFLLTLIAGLSTGIGATIAFFTKPTNTKFLSFGMGFSAGVMIYISFVEILDKSKTSFISFFCENIPFGARIPLAGFEFSAIILSVGYMIQIHTLLSTGDDRIGHEVYRPYRECRAFCP